MWALNDEGQALSVNRTEEKIMSPIKVIAYRWVPPPAQGLVRDLRVRWALEEAGLAYEVQLINFGEQSSESHRTLSRLDKSLFIKKAD
jgi:hypothetical protein